MNRNIFFILTCSGWIVRSSSSATQESTNEKLAINIWFDYNRINSIEYRKKPQTQPTQSRDRSTNGNALFFLFKNSRTLFFYCRRPPVAIDPLQPISPLQATRKDRKTLTCMQWNSLWLPSRLFLPLTKKKITKRQKSSFFFSMNLMTYFNSRTIITRSFFSLQPMCRCVNFPSDYFVNYIKSVQRMIASESCQVYLCEPHKQTKIVHKKSNENFCRVEQVSLMNLFFLQVYERAWKLKSFEIMNWNWKFAIDA